MRRTTIGLLVQLSAVGAALPAIADPITLTPPKLQFGPMLPAPPSVTITNTANSPVTIQWVGLAGQNANQFTFDDPMPPFVLNAGQQRSIEVVCRPVIHGIVTAQLVVTPQGFAPQRVDLECEAPPRVDMVVPRDMARAIPDLSAGSISMMKGGCGVGGSGGDRGSANGLLWIASAALVLQRRARFTSIRPTIREPGCDTPSSS